MPGTKRSSKIVSYNEDDDDDFIPTVDHSKKNRPKKSNECEKAVEKQVNIVPSEEEPKKSPEPVIIDNDQQESASSDDDQASVKNKRLKYEEDQTNENEEESTSVVHSDRRDCSNLSKRNSSVPLGFPTSKINIPSPHVSRVGLSRKSFPVKSLHPNLTSRVVHE